MVKLQKIDDRASPLSLYLEGDVLQLYLEMDDDQRTNIDLIEYWLKEAFSDGEFSAYTKLKLVRWAGNHMDVYTCKIQLSGRAGFTGQGLETAMKPAFMTGLPNDISLESC